MGVAPWAESFAAAHVFIPDIQATEKGHEGIDNHEFAVVAEVDLKTATELAVGREALDMDAFGAEAVGPGFWQGLRADLVEKHTALDSTAGGGDESVGQRAAEGVIVNNKKLHPHGFLGLVDGGKDRIKCRLAVDEEIELVAVCRRDAGEVVRHAGCFAEGAGETSLITIQVPDDGLKRFVEIFGAAGAGECVAGETGLAENQEQGNRNDW